MRNLKQIRFLIVVLAMMFVLVGCVDMELHATVNRDGTGILQMKLTTTNQEIWSKMKEELESEKEDSDFKKLEQQGFTREIVEKDGQYGVLFTKPIEDVTNPKEWSTGDKTGPSAENVKFSKKDGLFTTTYMVNADRSAMDENLEQAGELAGMFNYKFKLTLPATPDSHNADKVEEDGTLVWELKNNKPIQVEVTVLNMWVVVLLVILGIAIVAGVVIRFLKKRKNHNQNPPAWGQGSNPMNPTTMGSNHTDTHVHNQTAASVPPAQPQQNQLNNDFKWD